MIKKKVIQQAIEILRDLNAKYYEDSSKKKNILENEKESTLYLQISLKKIPESKLVRMIKVSLPHSLLRDSDEICLIMGDLDKKNHKAEIEPDILHYEQLLEKNDVTCISQVITLRQLRTDYKPYEAKQKLLAAYDMFLTDKKIAECLPKVLGRHFFKKRKFPIQINMKSTNLKNQIEKAVSTKIFSVTGHGNSCCSEVAYLDMDDSEIIANIKEVTETLSQQLPGLWNNVNGVYLKTSKSKAIPLYMSYENSNEIEFKDVVVDNKITDELSTIPNVRVNVFSDGSVQKFHYNVKLQNEESEMENNKTIQEDVSEISDSDLKESENETEKSKAKQKRNETKILSKSGLNELGEETKIFKVKKKNIKTDMLLQQNSPNIEKLKEEAKKSKPKKKRNESKVLSKSNLNELEEETNKVKKKNIKANVLSQQNNSNVEESKEEEKKSKKKRDESKVLLKSGLNELEETELFKVKKKNIKATMLPQQNNSSVEESKEEGKKSKPKKGNKILLSDSILSESMKEVNKEKEFIESISSKSSKRKRTQSQLGYSDLFEAENNFEIQEPALKKRKEDGINMKRFNTRKDSRKSKKKKGNRPQA